MELNPRPVSLTSLCHNNILTFGNTNIIASHNFESIGSKVVMIGPSQTDGNGNDCGKEYIDCKTIQQNTDDNANICIDVDHNGCKVVMIVSKPP
jgi:hypothetical protein